ncbi:MAG: ATP-binding protein [Bacillota bacterium]
MKTTLLKKMAFFSMLTVLSSILITGLISNYMTSKRFDEYLSSQHQGKVSSILQKVQELYHEQNVFLNSDAQEILGYAVLERLFLEVKDKDGKVLLSTGMNHLTHRMMGMGMRRQMKMGLTNYQEEVYPLEKGGEVKGSIRIGYFGLWNASESDLLFKETLNQSLKVSVSIALCFGLAVSYMLSKQLTSPLVEIRKVANGMRNGDLAIRSKVLSDTVEIAELSNTINHLGETLLQQEMLRKRLTSDMAHELRTPLTTLQTHIEALLDGVWEPTKERLESCYEEVTGLAKMVDSLQSLAKLEQAHLQLNKSSFNLSTELNKVIDSFIPQFHKKNLQIKKQITQDVYVVMDMEKFRQIMLNLFTNAVKYSYEGGKIEVALEAHFDGIKISVSDTGRGIREKDVPFVFERFYRGDTSRNRDTGGTGIGLTITKALVEAHGGIIEVESKVGIGTIFTLSFPSGILYDKNYKKS